jgi:citrate lyase gamma subunit
MNIHDFLATYVKPHIADVLAFVFLVVGALGELATLFPEGTAKWLLIAAFGARLLVQYLDSARFSAAYQTGQNTGKEIRGELPKIAAQATKNEVSGAAQGAWEKAKEAAKNAGLPVVLALAMLPAFGGCASLQTWAQTHETQLRETGVVLAEIAARAALNAAVDRADAKIKSDVLRDFAAQIRSQISPALTAADVQRIVTAWKKPNDGAVWERLTARIAAAAQEELAARGDARAADALAAIADGLELVANAADIPDPTPAP